MAFNLNINDKKKLKKCIPSLEGSRPYRIKIQLTNLCNSRCIYCNIWKNKFSSGLTKDRIYKLIDELANLGTTEIDFTGGEALLNKDIIDFISHVTTKGMRAQLNTNGLLLNRNIAEALVLARLKKLSISLDSFDPNIHDLQRGIPGSWNKILQGINYVDFFRKKYNHKMDIVIYSVVTKNNFKDLPSLLDLKNKIPFDEINLIPIKDKQNQSLRLNFKEIHEYYQEIMPILINKCLTLKIKGIFRTMFFQYGTTPEEINGSCEGEYTRYLYENCSCYIPFIYAYISFTGEVYPCCVAPHHSDQSLIMGNILENSFLDIWNGQKFMNFRNHMKRPSFEICKSCSGTLADWNKIIERKLKND